MLITEINRNSETITGVLQESPIKGPGAVMAIQLLQKYGKRDAEGHLLGQAGQPDTIVNSIIAGVQEVDPLMATKKLKARLYR